ncbi:MAG: hypothetical protein ACXADD_16665, partial [Candidatus Thorarchaeota archaeon]
MKLKLGISVYSVQEQSIDALIDFAREYNLDAIELWDSPLRRNNSRLSEHLASTDTDLSVHAPLLNLGDDREFKNNTQALRKTI